ncbi:MAG: hypothetical protein AAGJ35_13685, partial [Myxococcota bacterium]
VQKHFAYFNLNLCLTLLATFLLSLGELLGRIGMHSVMLLSLGLPVTGLRFFALFLSDLEKIISRILGVCYPLTVIFAGFAVTPLSQNVWVISTHIAYVLTTFSFCFLLLFLRYRASDKAGERTRLRSVFYGGLIILVLISLDLISYQLDWTYVFLANIGLAVYMYYLLQIVITPHLYWSDFIGRGFVLGVLSLIIAFIYWLLTIWSSNKELGSFFFSVLVASIVILILYDPLKNEVESRMVEYFFRQKQELRILLEHLRKALVNTIDLDKATKMILHTLERSKRATGGSLYLLLDDESGFERAGYFGTPPLFLVERGKHNSLLNTLQEQYGPLSKQDLEFQYASSFFYNRQEGEHFHEEERLLELLQMMEQLKADYIFPCLSSHQEV